MDFQKGNKNQRAKDLETLIVLSLALTVLGRAFGARYADAAAFLLLATALLLPGTASRIAALWLRFGAFLGRVNSRILLTLIFYLVLTPTAFLYRLFSRKDPLGLRKDRSSGSFWHTRDLEYGKEDLEKSW